MQVLIVAEYLFFCRVFSTAAYKRHLAYGFRRPLKRFSVMLRREQTSFQQNTVQLSSL